MRKIRGFKLNLRIKEVQRRAKKAGLDLESIAFIQPVGRGKEPVTTPAFEELIAKASASASPAVVFESFAHPDPAETALLSPIPGLAYSLVLATLGESFVAFRTAGTEQGLAPANVFDVVEDVALEDVVRFAGSILEQEAALEACELSPLTILSETPALELSLRKLDGSKIGLGLSDGKLTPLASRACSLSWLAKSKSKKK